MNVCVFNNDNKTSLFMVEEMLVMDVNEKTADLLEAIDNDNILLENPEVKSFVLKNRLTYDEKNSNNKKKLVEDYCQVGICYIILFVTQECNLSVENFLRDFFKNRLAN
jgi:hypothetical protein